VTADNTTPELARLCASLWDRLKESVLEPQGDSMEFIIFAFVQSSKFGSSPCVLRLKMELPHSVDDIVALLLAHPHSRILRQRLIDCPCALSCGALW
jgi:hypothetical protein